MAGALQVTGGSTENVSHSDATVPGMPANVGNIRACQLHHHRRITLFPLATPSGQAMFVLARCSEEKVFWRR